MLKWSLFAIGLAGAAITPASAGEVLSVYTSLDLDKCKLTASNPNEGGWAVFECAGHEGLRVRVAEGDLRYFVSFGPNAEKQIAASQTLAPFNTVHKTLEWRVERRNGKWVPFATILRYFWDSDGKKGQTLMVTKLEGNEACQVAHVVADGNPRANVQAREAADTHARAFKCGATRTMRFGPGGRRLPR